MKSFKTTAPEKYKWDSGYGGGRITPSQIATELFKAEISGRWLACYMLRRFGWPNEGSDDYKNFMSWTLTTPMDGLFLSVTPHLIGGTPEKYDGRNKYHAMNLHFGIRFTEDVGRKIDHEPGREMFWKRQWKEIQHWWKTVGSKKYSFGNAKKGHPDEKLVFEYGASTKNPEIIFGFYERKPSHGKSYQIPKTDTGMFAWWINDFRTKKLGEMVPKMSKQEIAMRTNPFRKKCENALRATMADLLGPTYVRDISFTPFGDIERDPAAIAKYKNQETDEYFSGAGHTPSYWYSKEGIASRKKKRP